LSSTCLQLGTNYPCVALADVDADCAASNNDSVKDNSKGELREEQAMRNFVIAGAAVAAVAASGVLLSSSVQATPVGDLKAQTMPLVEKTQFIIEGHRHCWYLDGWHGPGWYWCGYHHRRGLGWGGPEGWQGWRHEERERRRY
jgi:hypothetical protein